VLLCSLVGCKYDKEPKGKEGISPQPVDKEAYSQVYPNEPDGFRAIKWGMDISKMDGFQKIPLDKATVYERDVQFYYLAQDLYMNKKENLVFGEEKVKNIGYYVFDGKLVAVKINSDNYSTFSTLKDALIIKYGKPRETELPIEYSDGQKSGIELYKWKGIKTNIHLSYRHETRTESLRNIGSVPLPPKFHLHNMSLTFEDARHVQEVQQFRKDQEKKKAEEASRQF
jgi:hypothetical protein